MDHYSIFGQTSPEPASTETDVATNTLAPSENCQTLLTNVPGHRPLSGPAEEEPDYALSNYINGCCQSVGYSLHEQTNHGYKVHVIISATATQHPDDKSKVITQLRSAAIIPASAADRLDPGRSDLHSRDTEARAILREVSYRFTGLINSIGPDRVRQVWIRCLKRAWWEESTVKDHSAKIIGDEEYDGTVDLLTDPKLLHTATLQFSRILNTQMKDIGTNQTDTKSYEPQPTVEISFHRSRSPEALLEATQGGLVKLPQMIDSGRAGDSFFSPANVSDSKIFEASQRQLSESEAWPFGSLYIEHYLMSGNGLDPAGASFTQDEA